MDPKFQNALLKFRASLTERQRRDFTMCSLEDVERAINEIQDRLGSKRQLRSMKRIIKFTEAMGQLNDVVQAFLSVQNTVALVWVSTTLLY